MEWGFFDEDAEDSFTLSVPNETAVPKIGDQLFVRDSRGVNSRGGGAGEYVVKSRTLAVPRDLKNGATYVPTWSFRISKVEK